MALAIKARKGSMQLDDGYLYARTIVVSKFASQRTETTEQDGEVTERVTPVRGSQTEVQFCLVDRALLLTHTDRDVVAKAIVQVPGHDGDAVARAYGKLFGELLGAEIDGWIIESAEPC